MRRDEAEKACPGFNNDARIILDTALFAIARGARGVGLDLPATEAVHEQFLRKVRSALEKADWQDDWQREEVYLRAYAQGMGRRAALSAAEDKRSVITRQDIEAAAMKMRGYMPIAGRWCP
jgi:histone H3/H4